MLLNIESESMNKIKISSLQLILFLFSFCIPIVSIAQDPVLLWEDFESIHDTSWVLTDSYKTDKQSYKGQMCAEVTGIGEISYVLNLPEAGITELVVKGWIKLDGATGKYEKIPVANNTYALGDTVVVTPLKYKAAILRIDGYKNESDKSSALRGGQIGVLYRNSPWTYFEKEIKVPAGTKKIKIVCRNIIENSKAYFDEIIVERRQVGFVQEESSWAKSVRLFKEKASRLVKNGDFEEGGENWNQYWGFQLSDISHAGNYSCLIQNSDSGAWKGSGNEKLFKIPKGTTKLKVSTWIKADNIIGGLNTWETGAMLLSFTDDFGNEVPGGDAVARTVGTHDWRKFESYFSVSERATNFKIALQMAASRGKIYFDDILAEPMTDEEFYKVNIYLKNPGFENLLSGWPAYAGEATLEQAHSGIYSLKVAGEKAAWDVRSQTVSLVKNKKQFTFSVWMKTVGITETPNVWEGARVYIEFKDINGISLTTENVGRAVGNTDWQKYTANITVPEDAVEFTVSCGRANVSGSAFFDDASLEYPIEK
jgi:hypothetical protein